jgi:polyhydroxybutyrate depolymerase
MKADRSVRACLRLPVLAACTLAAIAIALLQDPQPYRALAVGCQPARPHASGTSVVSIMTTEGKRTYRLHVPPSYNGSDRVPLVLNFHGANSSATWQETYSDLSTWVDQLGAGFIVAYPQGLTTTAYNFAHFNAWQLASPEPDDVTVVSELLDSLESQLCIDANRVYSTGLSNGAMMSVRLACSLSSRIAAVGLVAGAYYPAMDTMLNSSETCPDTRAVPIIAFHGTSDTVVPFAGGAGGSPPGSRNLRLPIDNTTADEDVMADWAAHNGCISGRQEEAPLAGTTEIRLVQYDNCTDNAVVKLYIVDGGGHSWPGASNAALLGYTTHQVSANDLIWQFFQAHPLNGAAWSDLDGDSLPDMYDPDNDNDGCPDLKEQQTAVGSERAGGLRDPKNPWDYFNPTGDGMNRVDDIIAVIQRYGKDAGDPTYDTRYDRTYVGPNVWNLGPPDGIIRLADLLAVTKQFGHDCAP